MSLYSSSVISDEELLDELRKLGYDDVSSEVFTMIKDDLKQTFENENLSSSSLNYSLYRDSPITDNNTSYELDQQEKTRQMSSANSKRSTSSEQQLNSRKTKWINTALTDSDDLNTANRKTTNRNSDSVLSSSTSGSIKSGRIATINKNSILNSRTANSVVSQSNETDTKENDLPPKKGLISPECSSVKVSIHQNDSSNDFSRSKTSEHNTSSQSSSSSEKTMKRKVLRRKNGEVFITEEFLKIPFVLDTSYPDSESDGLNNSKSFSSEDLSPKSNSSSGSLPGTNHKSSLRSSSSVMSLTSNLSTATRILNSRKKKNDPVARYSYYKKFWDDFKPPGEKNHDKLRWAIRDKMMDYHL